MGILSNPLSWLKLTPHWLGQENIQEGLVGAAGKEEGISE